MPHARDERTHGTPQRSAAFMRHAMECWGDTIYRVALSQTRSHQDAQDVTQDVFLRLLTSQTHFESAEHVKAWLLRVTVNRCHELRRAWHSRNMSYCSDEGTLEAALQRGEGTATLSPTEDRALQALERHPLWKALAKLPDEQRMTTVLYYIEGYDAAEIARALGCSPVTVRTRLVRARKSLRVLLDGNEH